ncbi:MAG: NAD(P)/FAD-dependent oxidoreductase [Rhizobacter sp.]
MKPRSPSVVVVGGGLFGCSTAFQLAKRGVHTTLIEPDDFGAHASGNNPGNLNPIHGTPPALVPFALHAFGLHCAWAEELAELGCRDHDLREVRRIVLAFDESEQQALQHAARSFGGVDGFSASPLDAESLIRIEPRLSRTVLSGLLIEGNRSVNSRVLNQSLASSAAGFGATLMRSRVVDVKRQRDRIVGLHTLGGFVACDAVVFATGAWVEKPDAWLNFDSRVTPLKGEMLRLKLSGPGLDHDFTRGLISLYRRGVDECWIGVTQVPAGHDESPTESGRRHLLEAAAEIFPAIRQAKVLEHSASVRPLRPSGLPLVGRVPGWDNAYIANGGGGKGVLLSAGVGLAIAEIVLTGSTGCPVEAFQP